MIAELDLTWKVHSLFPRAPGWTLLALARNKTTTTSCRCRASREKGVQTILEGRCPIQPG